MTLKINQIGNSTGVIIPKVQFEKTGLKAGTNNKLPPKAANFTDILGRVNKQYRPALKELTNK